MHVICIYHYTNTPSVKLKRTFCAKEILRHSPSLPEHTAQLTCPSQPLSEQMTKSVTNAIMPSVSRAAPSPPPAGEGGKKLKIPIPYKQRMNWCDIYESPLTMCVFFFFLGNVWNNFICQLLSAFLVLFLRISYIHLNICEWVMFESKWWKDKMIKDDITILL